MLWSFEQALPNITRWVQRYGCIQLGYDEYGYSFAYAIIEGSVIWEGRQEYETVDEALRALEAAIGEWLQQAGDM